MKEEEEVKVGESGEVTERNDGSPKMSFDLSNHLRDKSGDTNVTRVSNLVV